MITFNASGALHRDATVHVTPSTQHEGLVHVFIGGLGLLGPIDDLHTLATDLLRQLDELIDAQEITPARAVLDTDGELHLEASTGRSLGRLAVGNSSGFKAGHRLLIEEYGEGWVFIRWIRDGDTAPTGDGLAVVTVTEAEAGE